MSQVIFLSQIKWKTWVWAADAEYIYRLQKKYIRKKKNGAEVKHTNYKLILKDLTAPE